MTRHFKLHPTSFTPAGRFRFDECELEQTWPLLLACPCVSEVPDVNVCVCVSTIGCLGSLLAWYLWEYQRDTGFSIPLTLLAHCFRHLSRSLVPSFLGHAGQQGIKVKSCVFVFLCVPGQTLISQQCSTLVLLSDLPFWQTMGRFRG